MEIQQHQIYQKITCNRKIFNEVGKSSLKYKQKLRTEEIFLTLRRITCKEHMKRKRRKTNLVLLFLRTEMNDFLGLFGQWILQRQALKKKPLFHNGVLEGTRLLRCNGGFYFRGFFFH